MTEVKYRKAKEPGLKDTWKTAKRGGNIEDRRAKNTAERYANRVDAYADYADKDGFIPKARLRPRYETSASREASKAVREKMYKYK